MLHEGVYLLRGWGATRGELPFHCGVWGRAPQEHRFYLYSLLAYTRGEKGLRAAWHRWTVGGGSVIGPGTYLWFSSLWVEGAPSLLGKARLLRHKI